MTGRSFYYWKSSFYLGPIEQKTLIDLHVNRLYVKFFDISWNQVKSEPLPAAVLRFPQKQAPLPYSIIPTVFITNDCIIKIKEPQVKELAHRIVRLISIIASTNNIKTLPEIQIDCDWSAGTKDKYFLLLQTIKDLIAGEKLLSATIRLHQYKYYNETGIPPVNRGLLMCYNMGNLKNPATGNSILEPEELKKYMNTLTGYSLPLDIALPIFSWKVLFRNKKYAGLINELPTRLLKNSPAIKQSGNRFEVLQYSSINGYNFEPGDLIREEEIKFTELLKAESLLTEKLTTQHFSVILYHLDSITLSKFSNHELETVFDFLH